eukprot:1474997-Rhodomonas_salina.1
MSGPDISQRYAKTGPDISQRYAKRGTDISHRYAKTGTDMSQRYAKTDTDRAQRYAMSGVEIVRRFAMSGTDIAQRYAMSGTEIAARLPAPVSRLGRCSTGGYGAGWQRVGFGPGNSGTVRYLPMPQRYEVRYLPCPRYATSAICLGHRWYWRCAWLWSTELCALTLNGLHAPSGASVAEAGKEGEGGGARGGEGEESRIRRHRGSNACVSEDEG